MALTPVPKPSAIAVDDLKLAGLAHAFDHVQGTDYDKGMKPKPARYTMP